jgi:hypothetical protein
MDQKIGGMQADYYQVPSLQVPRFFGRENALHDVDTAIDQNRQCIRQITVILCMGGQGKTQLALEYCHRAWATEAIFWLDASSRESLLSSNEKFTGKLIGMESTLESINSTASFAKDAIARLKVPWLLVLDDFECPRHYGGFGRMLKKK